MKKIFLLIPILFLSFYSLKAKDPGIIYNCDNSDLIYSLQVVLTNQGNASSRIESNPISYPDSIGRQKIRTAWYYSYKGKIITNKELKETLKANDQATKKFNQSKKIGFISSVLALVGGACIAIPIEQLLEGKKADWTPAAFGGGLVLIAFPIAVISDNQKDRAINIYNQGIAKRSIYSKELKVSLSNYGIGLCLKF